MMKWTPDITPAYESAKRTVVEWIDRQFRGIGNWTNGHVNIQDDPHPQYAREGYGGIYLSSPLATTLVLTTSWQVIGSTAYDSELSPSPVEVTQDLTNGEITLNDVGIWTATLLLTADIIPVTANDSNTVELGLYDTVAGTVSDQPFPFTVPRYGESINIGGSVPLRITSSEVGVPYALAIRARKSTPTITIDEIVGTDFHAIREAVES